MSFIPTGDSNLQNLHNAMEYNQDGDPTIRVTLGSENVTITGNVNVGTTVQVDSTPENPVHVHLTEMGNVTLTNTVPVSGTVAATQSGIWDVEIKNEDGNPISIEGSVDANITNFPTSFEISNLPATQPVSGTVTVQDGGGTITVDGTVTANVTFPTTQQVSGTVALDTATLTALENVGVTGTVELGTTTLAALENTTVTISGTPTVNIGTIPEVEIKNDTGNPIPISATTAANSLANPILVALSKGGLAIDDTNGVPVRQISDTNLIGYARNAPVREIDVASAYLIDKSGATASLGTTPATMSTVWDAPGLYPWNTFTGTGDKLYVFSTTDDAKIRGKQLVIEGLDSNYNLITDTVTFNNTNTTTPVATALNFYRIVRATVAGTNTNLLPHDYNIELHYGSSGGTLVAQIEAPYGQTQSCTYTVPAGFEAFVLSINGSSGKSDEITSMLWTRPYNDTWHQIKTFKFISGSFDHNFRTPYRIPEKSDVEIRAFALVESSRIGTEFQMLVIPKA